MNIRPVGAQPKHGFSLYILTDLWKTPCLIFMFVPQKNHGKAMLQRDASCLSCGSHQPTLRRSFGWILSCSISQDTDPRYTRILLQRYFSLSSEWKTEKIQPNPNPFFHVSKGHWQCFVLTLMAKLRECGRLNRLRTRAPFQVETGVPPEKQKKGWH